MLVEFVKTVAAHARVCVGVGRTPLFTEIAHPDCSSSTGAPARDERNLKSGLTGPLKSLSRNSSIEKLTRYTRKPGMKRNESLRNLSRISYKN